MHAHGDARTGVGSWPVAASVLGVAVLLVLDVAVGRTYLGVNLPALAVGTAIGVAVAVAARHLLLATLTAAATSVATTYLLQRMGASPVPGVELGGWPGMAELGGLGLLTCWSLRCLSGPAAVVAAGALSAALIGVVERHAGTRIGPLLTLAVVLGAAVAAGVGLYLRWIDHARRQDMQRARQDERLAIARELHDVVAHHVTGIVVQAQAAQAVWHQQPAAAFEALGRIEAAGAEALGSMRRLVGTLRADGSEPRAPAADLDELRRLADRSASLGLPVRLDLDRAPADLPADLAASVHRIVLEALTNARRHARGATVVDVTVAADRAAVLVEVVDDGLPAGARAGGQGYGITGMAERAAALGGTFRAGPSPGGGWVVRAELPLPQP